MNFIAFLRLALSAVALVPLLSTDADAFIRMPTWDDEMVDQSDLIVIAHLKENKFETARDLQNPQPDRKMFFTILVVSKVLKGSAPLGDVRVCLHDPNYPTVLDKSAPFAIVPVSAGEHPAPSAAIGIAAIMGTIWAISTDDIRQDHIWFFSSHIPVQYHSAYTPAYIGVEPPGLWFPEGIQPVKLIPYYQAIMKGDANAVAAYDDQKGNWWSRRVQFASQRLAVKQAVLDPDPNSRCDKLLKIYMTDGVFSPSGTLAIKGIMDCGKLGAAKLVPVFQDPQNHAFDRRSILTAWQQAGYKEATPVIIKWLQDEDRWWATLTPKDQHWAMEVGQKGGSPYNDPRAASFRNIYCSVQALGSFQGTEAKSLVKQIGDRWRSIDPNVEQNNLTNLCDEEFSSH